MTCTDPYNDLPPMAKDVEIEEFARETMLSDDLDKLEDYIFDQEWAIQSYIFYTAMSTACAHASAGQSERLEQISDRWDEIPGIEVLYEMVLGALEKMYDRHGNELGKARCVKKKRELFAKMQREGHPDAP